MNTYQNSLIYVVDDGHDEHYLLKLILADQQATCGLRFFNDGAQLLTQLTHRLDNRLPDLILLNLQMSILPGYEVLLLLKRDAAWKSIPVIAYNASARTTTINHYADLGYTASLNKHTSQSPPGNRHLLPTNFNFSLMYSDN